MGTSRGASAEAATGSWIFEPKDLQSFMKEVTFLYPFGVADLEEEEERPSLNRC